MIGDMCQMYKRRKPSQKKNHDTESNYLASMALQLDDMNQSASVERH